MNTDLFTLQSMVIEKGTTGADLFSVQGIVIEKTPAAVQASQVRLLAAQKSPPVVQSSQMRLIAAQVSDGFVTLPLDVTGLDNFKAMVARKMTKVPDWNTLTISKPTVDSGGSSGTLVTISPTEASLYRQPVVVNYSRRSIGVLAALKVSPGSITTIAQFLSICVARGYQVTLADIDQVRTTFSSTQIIIYANDDSYFFYKDSVCLFGAGTDLSTEFAVKVAHGFERGTNPSNQVGLTM